jgi:hypothetical protein
VKAPDAAQQFVLGEDPIGVAGQRAQEVKLHRSQSDARPADANLARNRVDLDLAGAVDAASCPAAAAHHSVHDSPQMQVARARR